MSQIDQNRKRTIELMHAENTRNREFGGDELLDALLESDPPTFIGTIDELHHAYAWPGKRTPIIKCHRMNTWFSTMFYHGQKLTCLECLHPIDVKIVGQKVVPVKEGE